MNANEARALFYERLMGLMAEPPTKNWPELLEQMSAAAGVRVTRVMENRIKLGGEPHLHELLALAQVFQTTVSYLVGDVDNRDRVSDLLNDPTVPDYEKRAITSLIAGQRALRASESLEKRAEGPRDER